MCKMTLSFFVFLFFLGFLERSKHHLFPKHQLCSKHHVCLIVSHVFEHFWFSMFLYLFVLQCILFRRFLQFYVQFRSSFDVFVIFGLGRGEGVLPHTTKILNRHISETVRATLLKFCVVNLITNWSSISQ